MRAIPIRVYTGRGGLTQLAASWRRNWVHYFQEALGLAIFMVSACFFSALLEGQHAYAHIGIESSAARNTIMAIAMGATALFIFYWPVTSPSGTHINPAVTLSFFRLGKMCHWDAAFYIVFQFAGGLLAVYTMQLILGQALTAAPVRSAVTVPGKAGIVPAALMEFTIAFATMCMVLFTGVSNRYKNYTRIIAACLVSCYVLIAGPVSGFGMNPARSLASALPSGIFTAIWIYMVLPTAGMLCATEVFMWVTRWQNKKQHLHTF